MDRTTKTLGIALAVSLALNLFAVGFMLGKRSGLWRGRHAPREHAAHMHERPRAHGPHPMLDGNGPPPDDVLGPMGFLRRAGLGDAGPEVRQVLQARRAALREHRAAVRRARGAVGEALAREPFEAAQLAAALEAMQAENSNAQRELHGALVELSKTLSPTQRKRMARAPWFATHLDEPPAPLGPAPAAPDSTP